MSFLAEASLPETYGPYQAFRENLGFLPSIFRAQSLLPRVIEAQAAIAGAVILAPGALSRERKEGILLAVSAAQKNLYCVTTQSRVHRWLGIAPGRIDALARGVYRALFDRAESELLDFGIRLALRPTAISRADFDRLRGAGWRDADILEAVQTAGLANFLCTLSVGLGTTPNSEPVALHPFEPPTAVPPSASGERSSPYLSSVPRSPESFAPFAFFQKSFGFIPNIFRAQTLKPEALEAEAQAIGDILLTEDVLTRKRKEYILLVISAANLNTYCVAVHCEMLRALGVSPDTSDQIAVDHHQTELSDADKALLDVTLRLARRPEDYGQADVENLRRHGFSEEQILEAIVMASMTTFLNTLQMGLGTVPDFRPRRDFLAQAPGVNPAAGPARPMGSGQTADPDAPLVTLAQGGDLSAFETLVRRHQGLVYRTLYGLAGNVEDAEDGSQSVFVKVFHKIGDFGGASRFSTWLTRIAINEGLEWLRSRKPMESLDEKGSEDDFRPSRIEPWVNDPESLYARDEMRRLVQQELSRLPPVYRMAVMLRDIQQLSTAEAAAALAVPVPTLKTRLLRGRLMLREALAVHFVGPALRARLV